MKRFIFYLFTVLVICIGTVSCHDGEEDDLQTPPEVITLELKQKEPLTFNAAGGLDSVEVITNAEEWQVTCNDKWCKVVKKQKRIVIQVFENDELDSRNTLIEVVTGSGESRLADTVFVKQASLNRCIVSVAPKILRFAAQSAGPQTACCTFVLGNSDDEVSILNWPDWMEPALKNINKEKGTADIVVNVEAYTLATERMYDLIVAVGKGVRQDKDTIRVLQEGIIPATITYTLEPDCFETTGGEALLAVAIAPVRAFSWHWEDPSQLWLSVDESQKDENILKLKAQGDYKGNTTRSTAIILEAPGAVSVTVTITQKAASASTENYRLGDIVNNSAGKAIGIVVKEKGTAPGLIMALKEYRVGSFFSKSILPGLLNSKDGEVNTQAILETYDETDCPGLWAALAEMNKDGETGWYLPSPNEWWDTGEYLMNIEFDRTLSDQFKYNWGTTAEMDVVQFNAVKRLITTAGGDEINLSAYHTTSMIGQDKYGNVGKMYYLVWGNNSPYGSLYGVNTYEPDQVGKSSYVIRLFKKF